MRWVALLLVATACSDARVDPLLERTEALETELEAVRTELAAMEERLAATETRATRRRLMTDPGDWVLDAFAGSGTAPLVAQQMGRRWLACDENYGAIQTRRRRCGASARACSRRSAMRARRAPR